MCCFTGQKEIDDFIQLHADQEEISVWKIYRIVDGELQPTDYPTDGQYIEPGDILSNRTTKLLENVGDRYNSSSKYFFVPRGIHVFTTRQLAETWLSRWAKYRDDVYDRYVIVHCTAKIDDLVAVEKLVPTLVLTLKKYTTITDPMKDFIGQGWDEDKDLAVFMKIHLSVDEYTKVMMGIDSNKRK